MTKRTAALLLAFALCLSFLPARAEEPRAFTDSTGRTMTLPAEITRVAVSGPLAQRILFALAPELLVGISTAWDADDAPYLPASALELPVLGQLYGGKGDLNLEELLAAAPQIVIDVGEPKAAARDDLDRLTAQTGIPFVHVTATLSAYDQAFEVLGALLGREAEAAPLAAFCRETYARAAALAASARKVRLLYVSGTDGLHAIARGAYHAEAIDLMGDNLAAVDAPSSKGTGNEVDLEQVFVWNPDALLVAPDGLYDQILNDPAWQSVAAVARGRVYEVPLGPDNWMGFPPSAQRLLGLLWMGKVLYPDAADYDLYEEAARYYELFYHAPLARAQYDALVKRSLGERP